MSGLKHPEFALLGTELQSFSVYAEEVSLLGQPYLSPVSNVAIDKYLFIIEDTTWAGTDTIFTLSFRPRKGVKTAAMKGQVFINTNGYAVQQVIAEAAEPGESFSISIRQQYEKIENRQWFPVQLNSDILFNNVVLNGHAMVGYGNCYLRNIELDPEYKAGSFSPVTLQLAKGATEAPDSLWDQYRQHPLDDRELKTYHVIDSLGDAVNLDEKIKIAEILMSGFVPMGPVDLDLKRILRFNDYEGLRLGIGLRTSEKFCSWAGISGYYAYGFRDKDNKYGGDVLFHINKKRNATLRLIHERDVAESSAPPLVMRTSFTDLSSLYPLFVNRMDRYEKTGIEIRGRTIRNITATWFGWRRSVETFSPYRFETSSAENVTLSSNRFTVFETGLGIRYAPGEKLARYGQKEIVLGGRFPVFHFRITTAVDLWDPSDFSFVRYEAQMDKTFRIRNTGDFTMRLFGGMVNDDVPLSWMFNMPGTYDFFSVATPMAFETARTNEFQHSAYGALFLRHSFRDLLFRIGAFRPHLVLVHNMATGKLEHPEGHSVAVHTVKSIFMESGIQIDQLIKSNFSGIGIGCFYRYGANHLPEFRDNFAIKLTVGYAL
ncbi:MAG: hypothetical protein JNM00_16580 [Flavobacteriales bacterium]|nr:hypothetical protein [Flavobacteriales bacterium]